MRLEITLITFPRAGSILQLHELSIDVAAGTDSSQLGAALSQHFEPAPLWLDGNPLAHHTVGIAPLVNGATIISSISPPPRNTAGLQLAIAVLHGNNAGALYPLRIGNLRLGDLISSKPPSAPADQWIDLQVSKRAVTLFRMASKPVQLRINDTFVFNRCTIGLVLLDQPVTVGAKNLTAAHLHLAARNHQIEPQNQKNDEFVCYLGVRWPFPQEKRRRLVLPLRQFQTIQVVGPFRPVSNFLLSQLMQAAWQEIEAVVTGPVSWLPLSARFLPNTDLRFSQRSDISETDQIRLSISMTRQQGLCLALGHEDQNQARERKTSIIRVTLSELGGSMLKDRQVKQFIPDLVTAQTFDRFARNFCWNLDPPGIEPTQPIRIFSAASQLSLPREDLRAQQIDYPAA